VLHRVDPDVDLAREQRVLDLLHEQALQAGRRPRFALAAIAARADVDRLDAERGMPPDERLVDQRRLRTREGAPARAEAQQAAMCPRQTLPGARPVLARCARSAPPMPPDPVGQLERSRARPPPPGARPVLARCARSAPPMPPDPVGQLARSRARPPPPAARPALARLPPPAPPAPARLPPPAPAPVR